MQWVDEDRSHLYIRLVDFDDALNDILLKAIQTQDVRGLTMDMSDYDGTTNLQTFHRVLQCAPGYVNLCHCNARDILDSFLQEIFGIQQRRTTNLCLHHVQFSPTVLAEMLEKMPLRQFTIVDCTCAEMPNGSWQKRLILAFQQTKALRFVFAGVSDLLYLQYSLIFFGRFATFTNKRTVSIIGGGQINGFIAESTVHLRPLSNQECNWISEVLRQVMTNRHVTFGFRELRLEDDNLGKFLERCCLHRASIYFESCIFNEESTADFERLFQPTSNVYELTMSSTNVFSKPIENMIRRSILNPTSPLGRLRLYVDRGEGSKIETIMAAVMEALKRNRKLQYLGIDKCSAAVSNCLEKGLPFCQGLQVLECGDFELPKENASSGLMDAFKRNGSIRKFIRLHKDSISSKDSRKLQCIFTRNEVLPIILEQPTSIPVSIWPEVIFRLKDLEYGKETCFKALRLLVPFVAEERFPAKKICMLSRNDRYI